MKGYARRVRRVLLIVLGLNLAVAVGKLVVGARANSLAIVGDGLHSGVDALTNAVALLVIHFATAPPDEDHPYGHAKYETLAAFVLSGVLFLMAFELVRSAVERLLEPALTTITPLTFVVVLVTLGVNVGVAYSEGRLGRQYGSDLLSADAAQTRADVLVTTAVLGGMVVTRAGYVWIDAVLAIVVAMFIAWSGYRIVRDVLPVLTDRIAFDPTHIASIVHGVDGVVSVHDIRSRGPLREAFVQMHLVVDAHDVVSAHAVADEVERRVGEELGVKEVFVHIEPEDDSSGPPGTRGDQPVGGRPPHGQAQLGKG